MPLPANSVPLGSKSGQALWPDERYERGALTAPFSFGRGNRDNRVGSQIALECDSLQLRVGVWERRNP